MNEFMTKIGYAVLELFSSVDTAALGTALKIMGVGMLGIFIVTCVIIAVITLLAKVFNR